MLAHFHQKRLSNLFAIYDADQDGYITQADLQRFVDTYAEICDWEKESTSYKSFQYKLTTICWHHMQQAADNNQDNQISLAEYLDYCAALMTSPEDYEKEVRGIGSMVFAVLDRDQNQQINLLEIQTFYRAINLDEGLADLLFSKLNLGEDGQISQALFVMLLDQFFRSEYVDSPGTILFGM